MLDFKRLLAAKPKPSRDEVLASLDTPWTNLVDSDGPLPEYPRPQLRRDRWMSLNGHWTCTFVDCPDVLSDALHTIERVQIPDDITLPITVPFSPEARLSGVCRQLKPGELLWYEKTFTAPSFTGGERVLLHFEAVDWACAVYVNRCLVGVHTCGYERFSFDVTEMLNPGESSVVNLCVADPTEEGVQLRGKQRLERGNIWYTAQSGIWQPVWLEVVPAGYVSDLTIRTCPHEGMLAVSACLSRGGARLAAVLSLRGDEVARGQVDTDSGDDVSCVLELEVPSPRLWNPDDPVLYDLTVTYGEDLVQSYCAFRTVEVHPDSCGVPRFFLNGEPVFLRGVLDQGYWPDGLMTPPCDEAMAEDILAMKRLGFNMLRKHIKVENPRWYYHCDRLGMLVCQDMVCGGSLHSSWHTSYKPSLFRPSWHRLDDSTPSGHKKLSSESPAYREEWRRCADSTVKRLRNHPCIAWWILFNEGWGQFDSTAEVEHVRQIDPDRPVEGVSGWYDQGSGDIRSVHNYFRPLEVWKDPTPGKGRVFFIGEFGGLSLAVQDHVSLDSLYGYDTFESPSELKEAVGQLLAQVDALQEKGLAGFVYTQLSDIEEEVNGILTYDRKVNKLA